MIKLVYCVRRRSDISREEFSRYWLEEHGPLVKQYAGAIKIRRYVQSHTMDTEMNDALRLSKGTGEPFDGIAELWWDSWEDFAAAGSSEGLAANEILMEDEGKFVDYPRSAVFFTEEHEVFKI
ncbi:MAG: EthD domain-containing protein [Dehalococcoidia bacterium]